MTYLLRGLYNAFIRPAEPYPSAGQWWFNSNDPALTNVTDSHPALSVDDDDDDDGESLPVPIDSSRPKCRACGDPNFSPANELCIACRLGMS